MVVSAIRELLLVEELVLGREDICSLLARAGSLLSLGTFPPGSLLLRLVAHHTLDRFADEWGVDVERGFSKDVRLFHGSVFVVGDVGWFSNGKALCG